jgi:hypothetical protein
MTAISPHIAGLRLRPPWRSQPIGGRDVEPIRRSLVTSATALPALAVPTIPAAHAASELAIEQLGTELSAAIDDHSAVCDRLEIAEEAMWEWERRNPKPEMSETDDADYTRAMERVAADLRAAVKIKDKTQQDAHDVAVKAWTQRKEVAERECGYATVHDAEVTICDETERLIDALAETPAGSLRALKKRRPSPRSPERYTTARRSLTISRGRSSMTLTG